MNKEEVKVFIEDFISRGAEFSNSLSYEDEEGYSQDINLRNSEILENEEELYFELVKQTKELPDDEIYDLVKQFFEELRGVENAK